MTPAVPFTCILWRMEAAPERLRQLKKKGGVQRKEEDNV